MAAVGIGGTPVLINAYKAMNIIKLFFDSLFGFVQRNPITCLVLVVLAVAFPPLFGFVLGAVVVLIVLSVLSGLLLMWRLRSVKKQMEEQIRDAGRRSEYYGGGTAKEEGDVSVHRTAAPSKRINSDVGEYVDFEEEKND